MPQARSVIMLGNNAWHHLGQLQSQQYAMKQPQIGFFLPNYIISHISRLFQGVSPRLLTRLAVYDKRVIPMQNFDANIGRW